MDEWIPESQHHEDMLPEKMELGVEEIVQQVACV